MLVITMDYRSSDCAICDETAEHDRGVPMYEDLVLPNDWKGEWFGQPACASCFEKQSVLTSPIAVSDFLL